MTHASNLITIRGDLTVRVRSVAQQRVLRTFVIRNTVTYLGMGVVVQLLSQRLSPPDDVPSALALKELWVGDGVVAPVRGDTALSTAAAGGFIAKIALTDATKTPNIGGPLFELGLLATLPANDPGNDGNGSTLTEAGLYTAGDVGLAIPQRLFARQIHPPIAKTAAIAVDYDWRIGFTA